MLQPGRSVRERCQKEDRSVENGQTKTRHAKNRGQLASLTPSLTESKPKPLKRVQMLNWSISAR